MSLHRISSSVFCILRKKSSIKEILIKQRRRRKYEWLINSLFYSSAFKYSFPLQCKKWKAIQLLRIVQPLNSAFFTQDFLLHNKQYINAFSFFSLISSSHFLKFFNDDLRILLPLTKKVYIFSIEISHWFFLNIFHYSKKTLINEFHICELICLLKVENE